MEEITHDLFYPSLEQSLKEAPSLTLPSSQEKIKSLSYYEKVIEAMASHSLSRDSTLIALGGGSLLDMAGFVASTYARGINLVFIPTTLLAMVDACFGGKTALNFSNTKNMIGTNYPADHILIDVDCLSSLPFLQMQSGLAEVIKYGLIADPSLLTTLEDNFDLFLHKDRLFLQKIIEKSLQIKQEIVRQDPFDQGLRRSLNFGHTLGHALEAFWRYSIPHGHAIAIGMILESYLSVCFKLLSQEDLSRVCSICKKYGFISTSSLPAYEELKPFLQMDKKNAANLIRSTLLCKIGQVDTADGQYCSTLSEDLIKQCLIWYNRMNENNIGTS